MIQKKEAQIPLYAQVKNDLYDEIENQMNPGDILPSEPELEKRFNVSRITIRRALDELVFEGIIVRKQGRGTFVREKPITQELPRLLSWSAQMRQMGFEPRSANCDIELIEPSKEQAAALNLSSGELVVRIRRLRFANDEPICIMTNYIPEKLVPGLIDQGLIADSLYATLPKFGLIPIRAEDKVEARTASKWETNQLQISKWTPLLQVTRLTRDEKNNPLYIAVVVNRGDKYIYSIHFNA